MAKEKKKITSKGHTYEVVRKLGEGYTGEVLLVNDLERGEPVALKLLNPEAFKGGQLEAFKREFFLLSDLHHPHLCKVYDFGFSESEERYFFTSELIQGTDLYHFTDKLSNEEIEEIFVQIADAIGFIHAGGLIHFDIKGANILITTLNNKPIAKIVDFGLAAPSVETPENIVGTVRYISPEMISKDQKIDYRADLYSLGIVLYRMLAKKYPEQGSTMDEVIAWHTRHTSIDKEPLEQKGVPKYLIDIVEKLTDPIPTARFSSAPVIIKFIELHSGRSYKQTQRELLTTLTEEGPLVARNNLMQTTRQHIQNLTNADSEDDQNPTLIITGPSGIGKTRMLNEIKYLAQLSELRTIIIKGGENGSNLEKLKEALDIDKSTEQIDLAAVVKKLQPLCLMVDDLDKCNQQVKDLFVGLVNFLYSQKFMGSPLAVFFIITMTTSGPEQTLPITIHLGVDEEHLKPLSEEEITQYIRQFLGESNPPPKQIKDIHSFSGGIPELVRTAIASLENTTAELPTDTKKVFSDRIGKLSDLAKKILATLTLAEKPLSKEQLISLTGQAVESGIAELNKMGLSKYDRSTEAYTLTTGALHTVATKSLPSKMLAATAKTLLDYTIDNEPGSIDEIVKFASTGAEPAELADHLLRAVDIKESLGEIDTAHKYYQRLISSMEESDTRLPQIYRKLSRFFILTGKLDEASEYIQKALKLTATTADDLVSLSWIERINHKPDKALQHIQDALNLPETKDDEIKYLKLLNEKAHCYMDMGNTKEAENIFRDTLDRGEKLPEDKKIEIVNNNLGLVLVRDEKFVEAVDFYQNKQQLFSHDKRLSASILSHLGYAYQQANMLNKAFETYKKCLELSSEIGDTHNTAAILGNIICICQSKALFSDALHYAQESMKLASQSAPEKNIASNLLTIGALYITLGLEDVAEKYLTEAVSIFQGMGDKHRETWVQLSFAYLYKNLGKYQEAFAYLKNVIKNAKEFKDEYLLYLACHDAAEVALETHNVDKAKEYVEQIVSKWPGKDKAKEFDIKIELLRCKLNVFSVSETDEMIFNRLNELRELTETQGLRELASEVYHVLGLLYEDRNEPKTSSQHFAKAKEIIDDIAGNLSEEYRDTFLKQQFRRTVSEDSIRLERSLSITGVEKSDDGKIRDRDRSVGDEVSTAPSEKPSASEKLLSSPTMAISGKSFVRMTERRIIGQSESIAKIKNIIEHVKDSHALVFISGETGVGKELIAKHIHGRGSFKSTPWKSIDFAEFPAEFAKDELFGGEKEALFEAAENGMLFMKHIEKMPQHLQKILYKALKKGKYERLRDKKTVPLNCRIISSSYYSMTALLKQKFNKKLLKLLVEVPIHIPPLRERTEDIPLIANYIVQIIAQEYSLSKPYAITTDALRKLIEHPWPGNVRELEQVIRGACVTAEEGKIGLPQIELHLHS